MTFDTVFFYAVAAGAVGSAILMITRRNPILSVLFLIVNLFCLAVIYLLLRAEFIAAIQILVYAGAIMVLFLFVIMLLNLGEERRRSEAGAWLKIGALAATGFVLFEIAAGIRGGAPRVPLPPGTAGIGSVETIGRSLFREYLIPFEITSLLLLAAMVGVIVLARKKAR